MCFARQGLGRNLGKCFQRVTVGPRQCNPGSDYPALSPTNCTNQSLDGNLRNRMSMPAGAQRKLQGQVSHRDYWYRANGRIIRALGRAMSLPGDVIFEFLYALTLQNFGRVLNPQGCGWNACRVPLSNLDTCDYYMGIFDCKGNLRNPYHPDSLLKLLAVMQSVLKMERTAQQSPLSRLKDFVPLTGAWTSNPIPGLRRSHSRCDEPKSLLIANRAGIGDHSLARANGRRRRFRMGEKYRLEGFRGELNPLLGQTTWNSYSKGFAQIFGPLAGNLGTTGVSPQNPSKATQVASEGSKVYCAKDPPLDRSKYDGIYAREQERKRAELDKLLYGDNGEFLYAIDGDDDDDDWLRRRELKALINGVKQKTSMNRNLNSLLDALQYLDLEMAVKDDASLAKQLTQQLSNDYNRMTARQLLIGNQLGLKNRQQHGRLGKKDLAAVLRESLNQASTPTRRTLFGEDKPLKEHYIYGAQVPVLLHEPFDRNQPKTWIRRHPESMRMNEKNELVNEGNIHRYKRQTIQNQLDEARQRFSIRTVYSPESSRSRESRPPQLNPTPSKLARKIPKKVYKTH